MRIIFHFLFFTTLLIGCRGNEESVSKTTLNQALEQSNSQDGNARILNAASASTNTLVRFEKCQKNGLLFDLLVLENLQGKEVLEISDPYVVILSVPSINDTVAIAVGIEYPEDANWGSKQCECSLETYYSSVGYSQFFLFSETKDSFYKTNMLDEGEEILCNLIDLQELHYSSRLNGSIRKKSLSKAAFLANYNSTYFRKLIPSILSEE